ncbi:GNAT family N-acetyltransferase [Streptomyces sp. NPDC056361]|uniref:GNAT family N-acetyltransferase n=1 Tax=Streptomyces sp. NPDC056361 TaxID=3345795 RepID=UPI0035D65363
MTETTRPWKILANPEPAACARTLAAAFFREPAISWICGDSQTVRTFWFDATLRAHATLPGSLRYALTTTDGQPVASAILTPPGATPTAATRAAWAARTLLRCGPRALGRTLRYLRHAEAATPAGTWTLEFIGVRPDIAGRGAGRFLLDHVLATTPAPAGFFLTTADPANVPLYRRFGFADLRRTPVGPLDVTAMAKPGTGRP